MPRPERKKLGETLVEAGLIDALQLRSALADQKRWGNRLGKTLVKLGFVEEEPLMRHLSRVMGYPLAEIRGRSIPDEVVGLLPASLAEKHRSLPLFVESQGAARYLYLGMEEPADLDTLDALQLRTGLEICPVLIGFRELDAGLRRHYGIGLDNDRGGDAPPAGGEPVGPDCLRHGDESLVDDAAAEAVGPPEPEAAADAAPPTATSDAPDPGAFGDPEESFMVGVTADAEVPSQAPGAPSSPRERTSGEIPTRRILQALTQVLVEKGVLTRAELVAQVKALASDDD